MQQFSSNFFGKDPFKWWIGQVTDPKKANWTTALHTYETESGEEVYSHRARVRIVGHHSPEPDLPDKDLPLAHVLLPANMSVTGGQGESMMLQGGETVIGFFADGEDGQQPVVFGTLFKQVADQLSSNQFYSTGQTEFIPYTPPDVRQNMGLHTINPATQIRNSQGNPRFREGALKIHQSLSNSHKENITDETIDARSPCEDTEIGRITKMIQDFIARLRQVQKIQSVYIDPVVGKIINLNEEVKTVVSRVHSSMTNLVRRARAWTVKEILKKLDITFGAVVPKPLQPQTGKAVKSVVDLIFCLFEKVGKQLKNYLKDSIENMINRVFDVPACAIENFLGDMFGQLFNVLDNTVGPLVAQLSNVFGGVLGNISSIISKGIKLANLFLSVLACDGLKCPPANSWSSRYGPYKNDVDNFDNILRRADLNRLVNPLVNDIDNAIDADPVAPDCNTNVLRCGPPRVDFFGGEGSGVTGNAVVNALGQIIGVAIDNSGFGFTSPPLITFVDGCRNGYGAGGYAVLGSVSRVLDENEEPVSDDNGNPLYEPNEFGDEQGVVAVTIVSPGEGFLSNIVETTFSVDSDGNVTESTSGDTVPAIDDDRPTRTIIRTDGGSPGVVEPDDRPTGLIEPDDLPTGLIEPDDRPTGAVAPGGNGSDGSTSYVTGLDDVAVIDTGFGYDDNDTADVMIPDGNGGEVVDESGSQVELNISDGFIIGASVVPGGQGFGFTELPRIRINSDTGVGATLRPILKFTRVDDASALAATSQNAVLTVIDCVQK